MFQHPSHRSNPVCGAYGRACGCGTCNDRPSTSFAPSSASYGVFKIGGAEGGKTKWEIDPTYLETCPGYKKQYNIWLKAAEKFENTRSFLGIRVGGKNSKADKAVRAMKAAKRKGEAALAKCQGKEFASAATPVGGEISDAEMQQLISGGGADSMGEGTSPLVYVIGAGVLAIGGLVVYKIIKKGKKKSEPAAAPSAPVVAPTVTA